jgi:hypothetical protein
MPEEKQNLSLGSYTPSQFRYRHTISRSYYHSLRRRGLGPELNAINRITPEAEAEWLEKLKSAKEVAS